MYQISRQGREAIVLTFRPAVFDEAAAAITTRPWIAERST
jgi:hypothetical protein